MYPTNEYLVVDGFVSLDSMVPERMALNEASSAGAEYRMCGSAPNELTLATQMWLVFDHFMDSLSEAV